MAHRHGQSRLVLGLLLATLAACRNATAPDVTDAAVAPLPPDAALAATPVPDAGPSILTANDLFAHPEWVGTVVSVDLVESLLDDAHSSAAPPKGYDVAVADVGAQRLGLEPDRQKPGATLPPKLQSPLRVRGTLKSAPHGLAIVVRELTPLPAPAFEALASTADLEKDPERWARHYVEVTESLLTGFEVARLGQKTWLDFDNGVKVHCAPKSTGTARDVSGHEARVRVRGIAYTKGPYGHLSRYPTRIVASDVTYLGGECP